MTIKKTDNGDGTTSVELTYTADTQKVVDTLNDAAHNLLNNKNTYGVSIKDGNGDPRLFSSLSQAEIGQIIDGHVKQTILDLARSYYINNAKSDASDTATIESDTRYL